MAARPATLWVIKRGGSVETFDTAKLAGSMWRAMSPYGQYRNCRDLAGAIELFMDQTDRICVSSGVVFEMTLKVLR
ncbi:MAG TPA: hypothetical protein ENL03_00525, partial [Phycisphaerae bacterium]|nr:hypothetical protein [Phycisphaerae bacterium]